MDWLEGEFSDELKLAGGAGVCDGEAGCGDLAEGAAGVASGGIGEVGVIGYVEDIDTKLHVEAFGELSVFLE